jgi:cell division transport system ATP-binding protein
VGPIGISPGPPSVDTPTGPRNRRTSKDPWGGRAIFRKTRDRREEALAARFDAVGLRYGTGPEIFTDIRFELAAGSFHFLTGASGAGKSSLLSLLYLAQRPTRGSITLFGREVTTVPRRQLPAIRRRIGVVFQDFRLLDHLSTLDNVALPLRVAGVTEDEIRRHVPELLSWVGLKEQMNAKPPTLSGGQKQRVAIARAVISRPDLLLADEPTGNVDDRIATRLLHLFIELNKLGTTILIATHSESLIQRFRMPRLHLENGAIQVVAAPKAPPKGSSPFPSLSGMVEERP